jgi:3-oxoacyl-[acyl-carrier-protein] synthase III
MSIGILGLGTYFPPEVRTNNWWSPDVVAQWGERMAHQATRGEAPPDEALSEGTRRTIAAMIEHASDPFRGSVERHVMPDDMTVAQMETRAARQAMERAGVRPDEIDVILTQTSVPDRLLINTACVTHRLLELPRRCMALGTLSACNAFAQHIALASSLIESGQARNVLSVHSSAMTRVLRPTEPDSAWWGDGAGAMVLGRVSEGRGLLGAAHFTDGTTADAIVLGVQERRWWDDGPITLHSADRTHTRTMLLSIVDRARDAIAAALGASGLDATDVDFYAAHQGAVWIPGVTASHAGLTRAKTLVTFPNLGNVASANLPIVLAMAERQRMLDDGSIVVTFSGGAGESWSSLCLRWGR